MVVPVYNEEVDLPKNIPSLKKFLEENLKDFDWEIVIANNASVDRTPQIADQLSQDPRILHLKLSKKGRGRALRSAWSQAKTNYVSYMDVDLSSDLRYFLKLIKALENGADVAIGSRFASGAKVYGRTLTREIISRSYNLMIKAMFWVRFKDAQCGFKALTKEAADLLLPNIVDNEWFFDTELLVVAEKSGLKVREVPIVWRDDPASTVKVAKTAWGDIKGLIRLFFIRPWRKIKNAS